jgi:hypothetical protein
VLRYPPNLSLTARHLARSGRMDRGSSYSGHSPAVAIRLVAGAIGRERRGRRQDGSDRVTRSVRSGCPDEFPAPTQLTRSRRAKRLLCIPGRVFRHPQGGSRSSGDPSHRDRRSGKAAGHCPGRVFGTHRSRTRTRNAGSAPHAANCATAPSSGTTNICNISSTSTSSTTTRTGPTAASGNAHRTTPRSSRFGLADRSDDTPPAADS